MRVNNKDFVVSITTAQLQEAIKQMATRLNTLLIGKDIVFLGVLNGSFMYMADLLRHITLPCTVDFIKLASYEGTESSGTVKTLLGLGTQLKNKHVVVVEDIADTGNTLLVLNDLLQCEGVAAIYYSVLLHKAEATKQSLPQNLFTCFTIPNRFVVGYGLDYDGYGRNLPEIYTAKE